LTRGARFIDAPDNRVDRCGQDLLRLAFGGFDDFA
jgi:hypothetical protein